MPWSFDLTLPLSIWGTDGKDTHRGKQSFAAGRRRLTEGASDERSKYSWFTDVAGGYDRVESSIREATY